MVNFFFLEKMALGHNVKSANELQFGMITIFDDKESTFFDFEIKMSCRGKPEDLENTYVCRNLKFKIYADNVMMCLPWKIIYLTQFFNGFLKI